MDTQFGRPSTVAEQEDPHPKEWEDKLDCSEYGGIENLLISKQYKRTRARQAGL